MPLNRLRSLQYDNTKETVTLTAATGPKADDLTTLTGVTKFQGINKLAIEAEVDKGELGIAEVKFLGGVPKGINALKFPATAKLETHPEGRLRHRCHQSGLQRQIDPRSSRLAAVVPRHRR